MVKEDEEDMEEAGDVGMDGGWFVFRLNLQLLSWVCGGLKVLCFNFLFGIIWSYFFFE